VISVEDRLIVGRDKSSPSSGSHSRRSRGTAVLMLTGEPGIGKRGCWRARDADRRRRRHRDVGKDLGGRADAAFLPADSTPGGPETPDDRGPASVASTGT